MTQQIGDPEVRLLATIAGTIEQDYQDVDTDWVRSPFGWI